MKTLLVLLFALYLSGCVGTIYQGLREANEASGLGGRKARAGETPDR